MEETVPAIAAVTEAKKRENDNHIYVSAQRKASSVVDLALTLFGRYDDVYLHGLSNAISTIADIGQMLTATGNCTITSTCLLLTQPCTSQLLVDHRHLLCALVRENSARK